MMREMMMMALTIGVIAGHAMAADKTVQSIPAPQVSVPPATASSAGPKARNSKSEIPYETITIPQSGSSGRTPANADTTAVRPSTASSAGDVAVSDSPAPAAPPPSETTATPASAYSSTTVAVSNSTEVKPASAPTLDAVGNVGAPTAGTGFGSETRNWTALQISGSSAAPDERPLPGEVATKVYDRYVQSFAHPIPERFPQSSFSTNGGSSGGGGN